MKKIILYMGLCILGLCNIVYVKNQAVTTQEVDALQSEAQNLLQTYNNQKKVQELKIAKTKDNNKQVEQQKLQEMDRAITDLKNLVQRLKEILDMPLSQPEAEQIKNQISQLRSKL